MVPTIRSIIAAFAALLPGLLLLQTPCGGQTNNAGDIRLTPEIRDYTVPEEAKIESAAEIGDRRFLVWGMPGFGTDSSIINELQMTVLEGNTPLFVPQIAHSPLARPYGTVKVIGVDHSFVLLWNDRRTERPGLYARRFDTNGAATSEEFRINLSNDGLGKDTTGNLRNQIIDLYSSRLKWHFLQVDSAKPFILKEDGTIDTSPTPLSHLNGPYYIGDDTSIAIVSGREALFFGSLWDTVPQKRFIVPYLDSALANSEILSRDTTGQYFLMFAVISDQLSKACRYWRTDFTDSGLSAPISLWKDNVPVFKGAYANQTYHCYGAQRARYCDNIYTLVIQNLGWGEIQIKGEDYPVKLDSISFETGVDRHGRIERMKLKDFLAGTSCPEPVFHAINRNVGSTATTIEFIRGKDSIRFTATPAFRRTLVPRTSPVIFKDGNELVVKWNYYGEPFTPQSRSWSLEGTDFSIYGPPTFSKPGQHSSASIMGETPIKPPTFIDLPDKSIAVTAYTRADSFRLGSYPEDPKSAVWVSYLEVQGLTKTGWRRVYKVSGESVLDYYGGQGCSPATIYVQDYAHDPINDLLFLNIQNYQTCTRPNERKDFSEIVMYSFVDGTLSDASTTSFREIGDRTRRRIAADRWLTFSSPDSTEPEWEFRIIDRNQNVLMTRLLSFNGDPISLSIAQNYTDKSLAVLWGSAAGVKGTFLNYALEPLAENVPISETADSVSGATGCYRNDTLFVVWEDYRHNGVPNVYGTFFTPPKASDVQEETPPPTAPQAMRARFDRASGTLLIEFDNTIEAPAEIELFDIFGNRAERLTAAAGTRTARIDAGRLASGTYLVRARTDGPRCYHAISHVTR